MEIESQNTIVFPHAPMPKAFVRLNADNTVTVISKTIEMGQGIHTGHATLVAEEIDAAPEQMRVEMAPSEAGFQAVYGNVLMGGMQGTGGNTGTQSSYMMYRSAGAAMRQMILSAAAGALQADRQNLSIRSGVVTDSVSGRSATFGELAASAMTQAEPTEVTVKDPADFRLIGKKFPRVDAADKVRGLEKYPQDLQLPGMLVTMLARPSRLGARLKSFDATEALKQDGVTHVVAVEPFGVAVVGTNWWSVYSGREKLKVEWDNTDAVRLGSAELLDSFHSLLNEPGLEVSTKGDVDGAFANAAKVIESEYTVPFQAHAPMETVSGIVQLSPGRAELWGVSQVFGFDSINIATELQIAPDNVVVHQYRAGGSFGRWYGPQATPWIECIRVVKAIGTDKPVKLYYSREDDLKVTTCFYRPGYKHRMWGALDAQGNLTGVKHRICGQSMLKGTMMANGMIDERGVDFMSVESSVNIAYQFPTYRIELHSPDVPFRASPTRFGGTLHNGFANEVFVDECAEQAGRDPFEFRLALLPQENRERGCLELLREKSNWSQPLAAGAKGTRRGRGVAVTTSHRSFSACVAEVTVYEDNSWSVDRCVVVMDCGLVINPDNLHSQLEGSVGFSVSLARYNEITFVDGECQQVYYTDYRLARMHTMPVVESHFVESAQGPSGAGETAGSSIIPAMANALASATGIRLREMPLRLPGEPAEAGWERPARLNTFNNAIQSGLG